MDELMAEVEKERGVMTGSGGGVTLSGGEPLMHPAFTLELLQELGRRGFHRAVDTTLFAAPGTVEAVVEEIKANISSRVLRLAAPTADDFRRVLDSDLPST